MLPCAPYLKNMCQAIHLETGEDFCFEESPEHGVLVKKETEVRVTDVKSAKVDIIDSSEIVQVDDSDATKVLSSLKPESPDVTRAAKKFEKFQKSEQDCIDEKCEIYSEIICDKSDETEKIGYAVADTNTLDEELRKEQEKLGAISKTSSRYKTIKLKAFVL